MIGRVIWITGLSGAGKTSLGSELAERLRADGDSVILLDGDALRGIWADGAMSDAAYDRQSRLTLALKYSKLAQLIASQAVDVIVTTISLFQEVHAWNRSNLPDYVQIYLRTPIDELRRRDAKGLYSRFDMGEIRNLAGLDLSIDEPSAPDLLIDFAPSQDVKATADRVMTYLKQGRRNS